MRTLFDVDDVQEEPPRLAAFTPGRSMDMRDYQGRCVANVFKELEGNSSTLYVMATGLGKTVTFGHITKKFLSTGRVLVLAHRQELIFQAQRTLQTILGFAPEIEMADRWADEKAKVVISTVQTQGGSRGGRKVRFNPAEFSLIIIDEAHHSTADSYKSVIDHYRQNPALKVVGCTATPDRADEEALGQIFDSVAFEYELPDAIDDGWLVPVLTRQVFVEGMDFSKVRTTAGDLNGADLAAIMEQEANLHAIADPLYQLANGRKTLLFAVTVAQAERIAEILNRHRSGCARMISGETPNDKRVQTLRDYKEGRFQFLCNCAAMTEGFDEPSIEIVVPKPTKSRALFAQMIGRGTRALPGVVDGPHDAAQRRAAIANSPKTAVEVIDFCGVTGRHELVSATDILGGNYTPEEVARAKKNAGQDGTQKSPSDLLKRARKQLEDEEARRAEAAKRAIVIGKASFVSSVNSPFKTLGIQVPSRGWDKPASDEQKRFLAQNKFAADNISAGEAGAMIGEVMRRRENKLATVRQAAILKRNGFESDMSFERAKRIIDILAGNRWRWPAGQAVPE